MSDSGEIVVEGRWAVEALVASGRHQVRTVLIEAGRHLDLAELLEEKGIPFSIKSPADLRGEAGYDFHRGVMAYVERPLAAEPGPEFLKQACRLVVPEGLADPGNVGTIIRSAVAFGAEGIMLEKGRGADPWGRKSIRASATAIFRVPVFEVEDLSATLRVAGEHGFTLIGTSLAEEAIPLSEVESCPKSILLFGSEKDGLDAPLQAVCDQLVRIPMANEMDSLNVAATAAIVCHQLFGE